MSRHGTYDPVYGFLPEDDFPEEPKPQTNADRIRAMSDEEMADEILDWLATMYSIEWTPKNILSWLKSPVEPGEADE